MPPKKKKYVEYATFTAPTLHRLSQQINIFGAPYEKIAEGVWRWVGTMATSKAEYEITLHARELITDKHGTPFKFIMAKAKHRAQRLKRDDMVAQFNISEYIERAKLKDSNHTRNSIFKKIEAFTGYTITMKSGTFKEIFTVVNNVEYDTKTGEILVIFNHRLSDLKKNTLSRYEDISQSLPIKSGQVSQFISFLQSRGQGIRDGEPTYPKRFGILDAAKHMHLDHVPKGTGGKSMETILKTIHRWLKQAHNEAGIPIYTKNKYHTWTKKEL